MDPPRRHGSASVGSSARARWMLLLAVLGVVVVTVNVVFFRSVATPTHGEPPPSLEQDARFAESLWRVASDCPTPRGIVLPLFDDIATLGVSLVLQLRAMGIDLPVEIPHCGDLDPALYEQLVQQDPRVRVYNVCLQATTTIDETTGLALFCADIADCHKRFRSFDIKVLAVVLSRFQELMLLDADTVFFQNPMALWDTPKYTTSGTLFFHDRISNERNYLAKRVVNGTAAGHRVAAIHQFLTTFHVSPYRNLSILPRPLASERTTVSSTLHLWFEPSAFLLQSHSWALRAGHEMDSSLVLWNKRRQPRATTILASFVARNGRASPPSYGDKELFFLSCELAETQYEFSAYAVGTIGANVLVDAGDNQSVLCGDALHYFPEPVASGLEPQLLYVNSDNVVEWGDASRQMRRTRARPASYYPGSFEDRGLDSTCPFNVSLVPLSDAEAAVLARRQELFQKAESWAAANGYQKPMFKAVMGFFKSFFHKMTMPSFSIG